MLTALAMLLSAAAGYAIAASLISTGGKHAPRATRSSTSISRPAVATAAGPPWLGVDTTDLPGAPGVVVVSVFAGSPAAAAGLEPGDVITGVGARPVRTEADLGAILAGLKAGERVEIQYQRGPLSATAQATLAPRPPHTP